MLDERGVEWEGGERSIRWRDRNGIMMQAFPLADGELGLEVWSCTPAQAIAATLCESPSLPHFWTHDGTLHVELPKLPESISVRLPDQRDREVRSARTWQYTRDSGTCQDLGGTGANDEQVFNCSECGCVLSLYDRDGSNNLCTSFIFDYPRYCPECGRKVVDE